MFDFNNSGFLQVFIYRKPCIATIDTIGVTCWGGREVGLPYGCACSFSSSKLNLPVVQENLVVLKKRMGAYVAPPPG